MDSFVEKLAKQSEHGGEFKTFDLTKLCEAHNLSTQGTRADIVHRAAHYLREQSNRLQRLTKRLEDEGSSNSRDAAYSTPLSDDDEEQDGNHLLVCSGCKTGVKEGNKFCPCCGLQVAMQCVNCSKINLVLPTNKFCFECGHRLVKPGENPTATASTPDRPLSSAKKPRSIMVGDSQDSTPSRSKQTPSPALASKPSRSPAVASIRVDICSSDKGDDDSVTLRVKVNTVLSRVFAIFEENVRGNFEYSLHGRKLALNETVASAGLKDGDEILATRRL